MKKIFMKPLVTFNALTMVVALLMMGGCGSGGSSGGDTSSDASVAATQTVGQYSADSSSPVTAGGTTTTVPATPADPVAKQLTLAWDPVAGATSYNLYWSTAPGVTTSNGTKISSASNYYVHTGLTAGTTYYYVVTAVNSSSESAASISASGNTM